MSSKRLPKTTVKKVEDTVDELFDRLRYRFLGPKHAGKRLNIEFSRHRSLPGLYEAAHLDQRGIPDLEQLDQMLNISSSYIEALRHKTKAKVVGTIRAAFKENQEALQAELEKELADTFTEVGSQVRRIVDTEAQKVRSVGVLDGIVRANDSVGIDDPIVFFVVVNDKDICAECKRLHLLSDGQTPRVWRLSELGHDDHKRGEAFPKVGGLHPHCRCSMTTLLPGFGFNKSGRVTWIKESHDELAAQSRA